MPHDHDADRPWNEDQWERFLRESEARSARFGDLLETLIDHPDRDEIIRREMGWDSGEDAASDEESDWKAEALEAMNDPPSEEDLEQVRLQHEKLEQLPAYRRGFDWSTKVHRTLSELFGRLDADSEEQLGEALADAGLVAAKIAAGHGLGYDEESLCGNIVCCKWSLEAARRCRLTLQKLIQNHLHLRPSLTPLLTEAEGIERLVETRITELRTRVWWE